MVQGFWFKCSWRKAQIYSPCNAGRVERRYVAEIGEVAAAVALRVLVAVSQLSGADATSHEPPCGAMACDRAPFEPSTITIVEDI